MLGTEDAVRSEYRIRDIRTRTHTHYPDLVDASLHNVDDRNICTAGDHNTIKPTTAIKSIRLPNDERSMQRTL